MSSVLFSGVPIAVVVEVYNYSQLGTLEMSIRMADCTCAHCRCFPMLMNNAPVPDASNGKGQNALGRNHRVFSLTDFAQRK